MSIREIDFGKPERIRAAAALERNRTKPDLTMRAFQQMCEEQFTWEAPLTYDDAWTLAEDQSTIEIEMDDFDQIARFHEWSVEVEEGQEYAVFVKLCGFQGTRGKYEVRVR